MVWDKHLCRVCPLSGATGLGAWRFDLAIGEECDCFAFWQLVHDYLESVLSVCPLTGLHVVNWVSGSVGQDVHEFGTIRNRVQEVLVEGT